MNDLLVCWEIHGCGCIADNSLDRKSAEVLLTESETAEMSKKQTITSNASASVPEVSGSNAAEMGDIENPENGPAEALVPESKAAMVSSKLDRMRSP